MGGQHLVSASDVRDDFIRIRCPDEWLWAFVLLGKEPVDGGLKVDERAEDTTFETVLGQPGKETPDGIEPGTRGWRKVEGEARVPDEPLAYFAVLVGGVVVEDDVDRLSGGHLRFDQVEKADELLMAVPLHVAADHGPVEHVDLARRHGVSEATLYNWKAKYGGLEVSEAKRLRALEDENGRLKRLLAEAMLDNPGLKDLLSKKW